MEPSRAMPRAAGLTADTALPTPIDAVFTRPLARAHTSHTILAAHLGLDAHVLEALSELDYGRMAGLTRTEKNQRYLGHEHTRAAATYTYRFPDGERTRAALALRQVADSGARRPLLVSHEMTGRMLLRNLAGLTPQ
jgi:broad specificity phosphatase PhoE